GRWRNWTKQAHVVPPAHGRIRHVFVTTPDRPIVERRQRGAALRHVVEAAQPGEDVRMIEIAKLRDDPNPDVLLRLDEFPLEQLDQDFALTGKQGVLPQLNDGTARTLCDHRVTGCSVS